MCVLVAVCQKEKARQKARDEGVSKYDILAYKTSKQAQLCLF